MKHFLLKNRVRVNHSLFPLLFFQLSWEKCHIWKKIWKQAYSSLCAPGAVGILVIPRNQSHPSTSSSAFHDQRSRFTHPCFISKVSFNKTPKSRSRKRNIEKTQHNSECVKTLCDRAMATIKIVKARQIFDSRGNPTVEVSFSSSSPFNVQM